MAKTEQMTEPEIWIEIWSGKKPRQFRSWRYHEILDELRDAGIERSRAYEIAAWAWKAKDGEEVTATGKYDFDVKIRAVLK